MRSFRNQSVAFAAAGAGLLSVAAMSAASPCIEPIDLGGLFQWGQVAPGTTSNLLPFRMVFDAATGETHAFGMVGVNGEDVIRAWKWDGFQWIARDTSTLTARFAGTATANITGFALDPDTRIAVLLTRSINGIDFAYAFDIDDFSAPLIPLGVIFDPGSAARSDFVAFARDEGAFYFFNTVSGVIRFDPATGDLTPTGAQANMLFPNLEGECVYDLDERRVVFVESIANPPRTLIYSLDANQIVETTNPAAAPPGLEFAHRLVANASTGDVFLVVSRLTQTAPLPNDALFRLSGAGDWTILDSFHLTDGALFTGAPAAAFDERAGQILLAGGWFAGEVPDNRNQAILFEAPQFAAPPASITVPEGHPTTLVALPSANSLYASVVWRKDGQVLTETGIPALVIVSATQDNAGVYTAEMVGFCGNTISQEFTLTVTCSGDADASGEVDFGDLNSVLGAFGQSCN